MCLILDYKYCLFRKEDWRQRVINLLLPVASNQQNSPAIPLQTVLFNEKKKSIMIHKKFINSKEYYLPFFPSLSSWRIPSGGSPSALRCLFTQLVLTPKSTAQHFNPTVKRLRKPTQSCRVCQGQKVNSSQTLMAGGHSKEYLLQWNDIFTSMNTNRERTTVGRVPPPPTHTHTHNSQKYRYAILIANTA